jgi:hypothetical protein
MNFKKIPVIFIKNCIQILHFIAVIYFGKKDIIIQLCKIENILEDFFLVYNFFNKRNLNIIKIFSYTTKLLLMVQVV